MAWRGQGWWNSRSAVLGQSLGGNEREVDKKNFQHEIQGAKFRGLSSGESAGGNRGGSKGRGWKTQQITGRGRDVHGLPGGQPAKLSMSCEKKPGLSLDRMTEEGRGGI